MPMTAPTQATLNQFHALTPDEQSIFREALPPPAGRRLATVWLIVVGVLGVTVLGFGYLSYQLIYAGKDATVISGFATTALGALIGLLAPSPSEKK